VRHLDFGKLALIRAAARAGRPGRARHLDAQVARASLSYGGVPAQVAVVAALSLPAVLTLQLGLPCVGQFVNDEVFEPTEQALRIMLP
jgi:hypothetical protein